MGFNPATTAPRQKSYVDVTSGSGALIAARREVFCDLVLENLSALPATVVVKNGIETTTYWTMAVAPLTRICLDGMYFSDGLAILVAAAVNVVATTYEPISTSDDTDGDGLLHA